MSENRKMPTLVEVPGKDGPIYLDPTSVVSIFPNPQTFQGNPMCYVTCLNGTSSATYTVVLSPKDAKEKLVGE